MGTASAAVAGGIEWASSRPVLVREGGHYGRIQRLNETTLIAGYDLQRAIHVSLSSDEGRSWGPPTKVAAIEGGVCTNTELWVLKNGEVLCFFNFRPSKGTKKPFSIGMCRSRDRARTWSPPVILYSAGIDFDDGCWEPACVALPDGELQVCFANEGPYRQSNEQEITMIRSRDNARTWSEPVTVSFRKDSRDGMPVPVLARNGSTLVMAIEDNGLSGTFKPVIVCSRLERGAWKDAPAGGSSPNRWGALAKPLDAATYAGAPYLRQFPSGSFILSFQMAASGEMKDSRMAVAVGTDKARDFAEPTFPFPKTTRAQLWNSLFIKDATTVTAVSETTIDGTPGIWAIDGTLRP